MLATTQDSPAAKAVRLTQDETYWAQFAEAAGWYRCVDGLWLRPAHLGEVPDYCSDVIAEISAPTAFAACQLDGLGSQRDKSGHDKSAQLTVEGLADAMRANRHNATADVLAALGFPHSFQLANQDAAVALARAESVTHVTDLARIDPEETVVAGMREAIGSAMPTLQDLIARLRTERLGSGDRRYTDKQINRYMRRVVHLVAKDFLSILPTVN